MNKTILVGRLTKDPQIEVLQSTNTRIARFILAVDRQKKDANGNKQADFISCIAFNNQADFIGKYIKKGNMIGVSGMIQTGSYTNKNGGTTYTSDVVIDSVESYTPRETPPAMQQTNQSPQNYHATQGYKAPQVYNEPQQTFTVTDDDVPF